ncbi:apical endosomal glycoprotein isoform X2 [Ascaphus truei]|uniref:apical endosomal glycoprotein isoform X2 n=1 Tax=Ascaphus truei TaxID=8439 RepID=UPI003F595C04
MRLLGSVYPAYTVFGALSFLCEKHRGGFGAQLETRKALGHCVSWHLCTKLSAPVFAACASSWDLGNTNGKSEGGDVRYNGACQITCVCLHFFERKRESCACYTEDEHRIHLGIAVRESCACYTEDEHRIHLGHFLRAGSGSPDPATLTSPQLQAASNESCALVLYYHMDGSDTSQLEIYYLISMEKKKVGGRWGQRGHVWLRDRVIFQLPDETFQIVIEGTVGNGADHFIALDDLILSPGCKVVEGRTLERSKAEIWSSPIGQHQFSSGVNEICNITEGKFDFESGEGRWKDRSVGRLRWGTENRTLQEGEARGYYLAVLHAGGQFLTSAEVHSPTFCPSGPSCAINMFYYFNSGPAGSLSVRVLDPELGTHTHVWHSQGEQSTSWRSAVITLGERQRPFQVVLAGSVDPLPGGRWGAAVDDIEFVGCGKVDTPSDTAPVTCNFETGLCGWYQDKSEEIDWELGTLSDHTTGSGNFLYVDGGSRMDRGMRARLLTYPQSSGSGTQCLSLYYRMWGPDAGTLNLFVKYDGEEDKLLWTSTGTHGNKWHQESVTLPHPPNRQYQLVLDAVRDGSVGHIAVDDITLRSASCAAPTRCSFEAGSCGFSSQGTYTWKLHQNLPVDDRIGPPYDHTLQSITGHYMLVDTSAAALPSKKSAILTSGEYNLVPSEGCLSFWYQLGGSKAGTLNVHLEEQPGKKKKRRLLSVSETHGDSWHYKSATLQSERGWTVSFEAVGAGGDRSYIALDDLHISHHPCHKAASCDFESGSCTWTNVRIPLVDTYDWDWTSGGARSRKSSAPEKDHSLGTPEGHYAFVDTGALHTDGSSAWLISEHLPATTGSCFTFWYRTDSAEHHHLGELMLFVTSAQGMLPVWGLLGYHNNDWQEEQIQLNSTVEFQIVFEASKGSRPHAATVALDDVKYTLDTPCNTKKEKAKDNTRTTVIVILVVILILLVAIVAVLLYRRRKRRQEGAPQMSSHVDGFDNIIFQENEDTLSTD